MGLLICFIRVSPIENPRERAHVRTLCRYSAVSVCAIRSVHYGRRHCGKDAYSLWRKARTQRLKLVTANTIFLMFANVNATIQAKVGRAVVEVDAEGRKRSPGEFTTLPMKPGALLGFRL